MTEEKNTVDPFWVANLSDIEAEFLDEGKKIVDLPTHLNEVVPSQGSVLLENVFISEQN